MSSFIRFFFGHLVFKSSETRRKKVKNSLRIPEKMKVAVVSKFGETDPKVIEHIQVAGLDYVQNDPEVVLAHGGDGTFLIAERLFPGIPKLLLKDSKICKKCGTHTVEDALQAIRKNTYKTQSYPKLKAEINGKKLFAVNDIVIRNDVPIYALRFEIKLDQEKIEEELIGDGIVLATPFGADAYFYSIAKRGFNTGFGLAFNNLTKDINHFNFEDTKTVEVKITRGEAVVVADNNPDFIKVKEGDIITIKKAEETAKVITLH